MAKPLEDEPPENTTPTGKMARTAVAGMTAARVGAKKLRLLSKRPFLSQASFAEQQVETDDEIAKVVFQGLTKLRGGAMKAAQMLSLDMMNVLPEAYQRELSKACYQVPPLNRAVVRRLLIAEFGKPPEEIFASFDATAFAAASLGQVHAAQSHANERLAVKVQYPGIGQALQSDIQLARRLMQAWANTEYVANMVQELERRLMEEIDYHLEYRNTQWFYEHVQLDGIVIPEPFAQYSSTHVLTTAFVEGMHLDAWLATGPTQAEKDHAAQLIYEFWMHSLFRLHHMHSDPNPGNYLFQRDGNIAVVDFGSVKIFTPEFCEQLRVLLLGSAHQDHEKIAATYYAMGLGEGDRALAREIYHTKLVPVVAWLSRPFHEEVFDFGRHKDFLAGSVKLFQELITSKALNGFTNETLAFDRTMQGLYGIFSRLGAKVRMRDRLLDDLRTSPIQSL